MTAFRRRVFTTLLAVALAVPAFAQETRGTIEGVVKDASGGVLPGVTVEAKAASGATISATTDAEGRYRFPALPVGTYTVVAALQGFNSAQRADVLLTIGQQLKIDLTLTVGTVTESVSVRAEAPIVDVKKNAVSTTITSEVIDLIPKGRNFLDAIIGIPGTNDVGRAGGIMIDGATATENRYVVDGMDTTSPQTGVSGKRIPVDFIDQIQVQRSGYNAEYRAATGGVISAVSKSGTNRFRGDIGLNYNGPTLNKPLQGKVRPSLNISTIDNVTLEYVYPTRVHDTSTFEPVFTLSGPIFENRLWFFGGFAPQRQTQTRTVTWSTTNTNGPQTQTFEDRDKSDEYNYSITSQLTGRLRARFNGSNSRTDPGLSVPSFDANSGVSTANPLSFNPQPQIRTFTKQDSYSGHVDWTALDNVFAKFVGGYYIQDAYSGAGDYYHGTRRTFSTSNLTYAIVPQEFRRASGFADNPANTFNEKNAYQRVNLNADVTTFRSWRGQHAITGGVQYERLGNQVDTGQQHLNIAINWDRSYQTVTGQTRRGTYGYYTASRQFTGGDVTSHNVGLFLQDQWSATDQLTFNVGLRTDRTHIPSYRPENPSLSFGFQQKLAPRVGFAYDIKGDARWKAYGSWGIFYDIEKLEMPRGLWGAEKWVQYVYTLDDPNWINLDCADTEGSTGCPGTLIERLDRRHVSNEPDNFLVDENLKPMKSQEATIGLDHELNNISSVGVRYTHKWLNTAIEDVGVIDPIIGAEIFYIANPGEGIGEFPLGPEYPATPKAKRVYDGIDFSYNRRLHNNWSLNASVLLSRLWGNYTGLTNAQSESARNSPNVTRAFDGLFMSFDANGDPVYGRNGVDMPIQLKALGTYMTPWGTSVGVDFRGSSGLLQTTFVTYQTVPVPVEGYGDLGRTPFFTQFDLLFSHTFRLPRSMQLSLQLNVNNVFDQDTVTAYDTSPFLSGGLSFPTDGVHKHTFFNGFDWRARMAQINAATPTIGQPDPRYGSGLGTSFQGARSLRFYGRFSF